MDRSGDMKSRDLSRHLASAALWWGLPLVVGMFTNILPISSAAVAIVWAIALVWMGTGCVLNALRCGRLHCYIAAPVLLVGAIGVGLTGLGLTSLPLRGVGVLINGALGLAALSFLAEPIWGMYRSSRAVKPTTHEQSAGPRPS